MRIFISWSGEQSKGVAAALKPFIEACLQTTEVWFSDQIPNGAQWRNEIYRRIKEADQSIAIFARTNLKDGWVRSWLGFEAGMLACKDDSIQIFSVGLERSAFENTPFNSLQLAQAATNYQITTHDRESVFRMLDAINRHAAFRGKRKTDNALRKMFDRHWKRLDISLQAAVNLELTATELKDMLEKIIANDTTNKALQAHSFEQPFTSAAEELRRLALEEYGLDVTSPQSTPDEIES